MTVGPRIIEKPIEDGYDKLWVDFNLGTKMIRVYCQPKNASNDLQAKWDSITIESNDVLNLNIVTDGGKQVLIIHLSKHGYLLFDSTSTTQFSGFTVEMTFAKSLPVEAIMTKMCPHVTTPMSQESEDMFNTCSQRARAAEMEKVFNVGSGLLGARTPEEEDQNDVLGNIMAKTPKAPTVIKKASKLSLSRKAESESLPEGAGTIEADKASESLLRKNQKEPPLVRTNSNLSNRDSKANSSQVDNSNDAEKAPAKAPERELIVEKPRSNLSYVAPK